VPVIPSEKEFPYTLRLVSEVLSSNGSFIHGLRLRINPGSDGHGCPDQSSRRGCCHGLIKEGDRYVVLTDIQGAEDHLGDMDFKVAGTPAGITALQMDIKIKGITSEIMALPSARPKRHVRSSWIKCWQSSRLLDLS